MTIVPQFTVNVSPMEINGMSLSWVNKLSHLGVVILSGKTYDVDISCVRRKFFSSVNSIFSRSSKFTENVKLHLCEAHCLPILYMPRNVLILLQLENVKLIVSGTLYIVKYLDIVNGSRSGS